MTATVVVIAAVIVYLLIGLASALRFRRDGHTATAAAALFTWPLLLDGGPPTESDGDLRQRAGPYTPQIRKHLDDLGSALKEPGVEGLVSESDLAAISRALHAADARVGTVDRMLADPAIRQAEQGARLESARDAAAAEVEAVLKGLVQLRVQLGLVALVGETAPVQDRLRELSARLGAIDELGGIGRVLRRSTSRRSQPVSAPTPPSPEDPSNPESPAPR